MKKRLFISFFSLLVLIIGSAVPVFAGHGDVDRNCGDFNGDAEAVMQFWYDHGYSAENDPSNLDGDADGLPCEVTTEGWEAFVASQEDEETDTDTEEVVEESETVSNDRDCASFATHEEVMAFWYTNGYGAENDPHGLDRDNDNLPCEVSQDEWDAFVAEQEEETETGTEEEAVEDNEEAVEEEQEEEATEEDNEEVIVDEEEGGELADTATTYPTMLLFGALLMVGGLALVIGRRKA